MQLKEDFIPDTAKCATHALLDPSSITIHWIGPYPGQTPEQVRQYWIDSEGEASAHFIVKGTEVLQCWPTYKVAWHTGCRSGNYTSIGIEVVPKNEEGEFSDETIVTLRKLIYKLRSDLNKSLPLVRHFDWTGKECPIYYCDSNKWEALLKRLK